MRQRFGLGPAYPGRARSAFEQAVRDRGLSKYQITERDSRGNFVAAGNREEYYPIRYIKPFQENQSFQGLDLAFDPAFRKIARQAIASGCQVAAVGPSIDDRKDSAKLLYVVEKARNGDSDRANRPADQPEKDGLVLGVFNIGAVVESSLALFPHVGIDIYIYEPADEGGEKAVYARISPLHENRGEIGPKEAAPDLSSAEMRHSETIDVSNAAWTVVCVPTEFYCAAANVGPRRNAPCRIVGHRIVRRVAGDVDRPHRHRRKAGGRKNPRVV